MTTTINRYRLTPPLAIAAIAATALWAAGCSTKLKQESVSDTSGAPPETPAAASERYDTLSEKDGALFVPSDGKAYKTVRIGAQTWMAENLNHVPDNGKSWCYNNDKDSCVKYGRLYDWEAARTVCPAGWHLPSAAEWDELTGWVKFMVGAKSAKRLAAAGRWNTSYLKNLVGAADDYGFSALPGGLREPDGRFINTGCAGAWWTDTEEDGEYARERGISCAENTVTSGKRDKNSGCSVRCVRDEAAGAPCTLSLAASDGGTAAAYPRGGVYSAGKRVTIRAAPDSGYAFDKWTGGKTADSASASAAVTMDSNMAVAACFRPIVYGMLSDYRDGRTYKTVKMPDGMVWMAENLNYAPPSGGSRVYNSNSVYSDKYGRLYDWEAAKKACPKGWRLPTRQMWNRLGEAAGGRAVADGGGGILWRGAGGKLKAAGGWGARNDEDRENWNGTDDYGFSALPGGGFWGGSNSYYYGNGGDRAGGYHEEFGAWWTATAAADSTRDDPRAFSRRVSSYGGADLAEHESFTYEALSVRCVTDAAGFAAAASPPSYSLTVRAARGGTASAAAVRRIYTAGERVAIPAGEKFIIAAAPNCGFAFSKWIDGETEDSAAATTAVTLNSNTTVTAVFARVTPYVARGAFTDKRDGKTYKTVQICKHIWMAENLRYKAGGGGCYGGRNSNCVKYGRLYDWEAAKKSCPAGWHLASDDEWRELEGYAAGMEKGISGKEAGGGRLKAKRGWKKYLEKDGGTDDFGFSALPGGAYDTSIGYFFAGEVGLWWTSAEPSDDVYDKCCRNGEVPRGGGAVVRRIAYGGDYIRAEVANKSMMFSVRCVSDEEGRVPPPAARDAPAD